mgnify:CR=1 FL=1|jgi:hypothetical protein|tara:strand:- start:647 stop:1054 length:408 start_codon:yes stop_codon:yes gene_type:complete
MTVELMKAVYGKLTGGSNSFTTGLGGRIFAVEAPANTAFPLAIYAMESVDTQRFFDGRVQQRGSISVAIFDKAEAGADSIVDKEKLLFDLMDEASVSVDNHDRGYIRGVTRGTPSIDGELLQVESIFEITATSST